jgi:hypothetical protein
MRKFVFIILTTALNLSCSDMLEETPKNFISKSNYYLNETEAEAAITGAYSSFDSDYYGIEYYLLVELHADFLIGRGGQAPISFFDQVLDFRGIGYAATSWNRLYQAINRANAVLDNVPGIENISESKKAQILAEAHFLRAMAYFNLVRFWGPVPLKISESSDLTTGSPREPESKVYDLILADAIKAEQDLPESVGGATGRASKWAAKMLLAQVYLTLENWEEAAKKANDVLESGRYTLVSVEKPEDFYKIFATETHSEDIMSIHHSPNNLSSLPSYLHRPSSFPYNYSSQGFFAWIPDMNSFIGNDWDERDLRKSFNLYTKYVNAAGNTVSLPSDTPVLFKKFITNPAGLRVYSVPVYRYTEAFLIYAEASCMAAGAVSDRALESLNKIKRRAYGLDINSSSAIDYLPGMSKEEFRDTVIKERAYEFLIEGRRWWDLKRTNKVKQAMAAVGKSFIDERYFLPIPPEEINNNPLINQEDQNP